MDCKTSRPMRVADWNEFRTNLCKLHYWCKNKTLGDFFPFFFLGGGGGGGGGVYTLTLPPYPSYFRRKPNWFCLVYWCVTVHRFSQPTNVTVHACWNNELRGFLLQQWDWFQNSSLLTGGFYEFAKKVLWNRKFKCIIFIVIGMIEGFLQYMQRLIC